MNYSRDPEVVEAARDAVKARLRSLWCERCKLLIEADVMIRAPLRHQVRLRERGHYEGWCQCAIGDVEFLCIQVREATDSFKGGAEFKCIDERYPDVHMRVMLTQLSRAPEVGDAIMIPRSYIPALLTRHRDRAELSAITVIPPAGKE